MTSKNIYDNFQKEKSEITINLLIELGLIDIKFMERYLIKKYFKEIKNKRGIMQSYFDLAEQFCKSEDTIRALVNKPIVVYW